jgi:hypothetical protein
MAELVKIEGTELEIREYNGQRVVTLKDIDRVHEKKTDTAKKSFQKHKKHFILGEDYFEITRRELGERYSPKEKIMGNPSLTTYLLTESGYLMIVKTFTDDLSWQVQRQLVNAYFKAKAQPQTAVAPVQVEDTKYNTSNTLVPKVKSWYIRNRSNLEWVAYKTNCKLSYVCHRLLKRIGEEYDLDAAKKIYEAETGHAPQYPLDIVDYFPQLSAMATWWLNDLIKVIEEENK